MSDRRSIRLAYVAYWNRRIGLGVLSKIQAQTTIWRQLGVGVEIYWSVRTGDAGVLAEVAPEGSQIFAFETVPQRVLSQRRLARALKEDRPDIVYVRFDLFSPFVWGLLRSGPVTAVEIQSDDIAEYKGRRIGGFVNRLNRRALLGRCDVHVHVSKELAQRHSFARYGKPSIVVPNSGAEPREPFPAPASDPPLIVFVGGAAHHEWSGVDKILALARALPEFKFELVGVEATGDVEVPNVLFRGKVPSSEVDSVLRRADVAVGSLALHRKFMNEASPLKIRRYLLSGIPTILGYHDSDFADLNWPFVLRLPNTEHNVRDHIDEIRRFVLAMKGQRAPRSVVEPVVGYERKEQTRIAYLSRLCDSKESRR